MKTKKLKPLPLPARPLKTIKEVKAFVIKLLRLGRCQGPFILGRDGRKFLWLNARSESVCKVCLVAAVERSTDNPVLQQKVFSRLDRARPKGCDYIAAFNDDPKTTLAQVIELVKKA